MKMLVERRSREEGRRKTFHPNYPAVCRSILMITGGDSQEYGLSVHIYSFQKFNKLRRRHVTEHRGVLNAYNLFFMNRRVNYRLSSQKESFGVPGFSQRHLRYAPWSEQQLAVSPEVSGGALRVQQLQG